MKQLTAIIIGAGGRGSTFSTHMKNMSDKFKVVGVADPVWEKCRFVRDQHGFGDDTCFPDWKDILARPKMADIAVIATGDDLHYGPAMKAIELGYDILLEKPAAFNVKQCTDIANAAREKGVSVLVCHVLRYTPFFKTVRSIIKSGTIGDVVSVALTEAVGLIHFSHSFVRGNWHTEKESAPMVIAKTCHDLDMIQWLIDKPCKKVSSFGSLTHFTSANAPEGAPHRCIDGGCPIGDTCPYNCRNIYIDNTINSIWKDVFKQKVATHPDFTDEELVEALKTTDYGLCVYHANNDLVDHQVVDMEFAGGITASLNLNAFNKGGRHIRVYGTKGELWAYAADTSIHVHVIDREGGKEFEIPVVKTEESIAGGHGGGDTGILTDLYDFLTGKGRTESVADIGVSVANHMIGFAAEESRHNSVIVDLDEFCTKNNYKNLE
ncbi:MAG: Gfo/Idh/MocA family oxidoreductase [Clostridia bacterium]|nr:Gfo/Idh/MocA family oxidoreductase [Clostridia bacterium]